MLLLNGTLHTFVKMYSTKKTLKYQILRNLNLEGTQNCTIKETSVLNNEFLWLYQKIKVVNLIKNCVKTKDFEVESIIGQSF